MMNRNCSLLAKKIKIKSKRYNQQILGLDLPRARFVLSSGVGGGGRGGGGEGEGEGGEGP